MTEPTTRNSIYNEDYRHWHRWEWLNGYINAYVFIIVHWFLHNSITRVICFATIRPRKKARPDGIVNLCGCEIRRLPRAINRYYSFRLMHDLHYLHWPRRRRNLKDRGKRGKTKEKPLGTPLEHLKKNYRRPRRFHILSLSLSLSFSLFLVFPFLPVEWTTKERERKKEREKEEIWNRYFSNFQQKRSVFRLFSFVAIDLSRGRK